MSQSLTVFGLFILTCGSLHAEETLRYPFMIPAKPVLSKQAFDLQVDMATGFDQADSTASSMKYCPSITTLFNKIFDKMVDANHLRDFRNERRPGINFSVACINIHSRGTGKGPDVGAYSSINMPASIMAYSYSEDEIASTIGHEIAHILLGHLEAILLTGPASTGFSPEPGIEERARELLSHAELDADKLGVILMLNAGYNPRAAIDSLWYGIQFDSDNFFVKYSPFFLWNTGSDYMHPTLGVRAEAIRKKLDDLGYRDTKPDTVSPDFAAAKEELKRLERDFK